MNILWHLSEGFGINTDIFETNVLNLAVVLGVLVVFGSDVLTSILDSRRDRIVQSMESADKRFQEAQAKLSEAKAALAEAQEKATQIRSLGDESVQQATSTLAKQAEEEMKRLEEGKGAILALAEQKATKQVQQSLAALALEKASFKLKRQLTDTSVQKQLVDLQIGAFAKSRLA
jgi:F-type H+-transporting ATPase subunit b